MLGLLPQYKKRPKEKYFGFFIAWMTQYVAARREDLDIRPRPEGGSIGWIGRVISPQNFSDHSFSDSKFILKPFEKNFKLLKI